MSYYSCLLCEEAAERVGAIEEHLREEHDVFSNPSGRWEKIDGDLDALEGSTTFLSDFS